MLQFHLQSVSLWAINCEIICRWADWKVSACYSIMTSVEMEDWTAGNAELVFMRTNRWWTVIGVCIFVLRKLYKFVCKLKQLVWESIVWFAFIHFQCISNAVSECSGFFVMFRTKFLCKKTKHDGQASYFLWKFLNLIESRLKAVWKAVFEWNDTGNETVFSR